MSIVVEPFPQFIDVECLIEALNEIKETPRMVGDKIQIRNLFFEKNSINGYILRGESYHVRPLLNDLRRAQLDQKYKNAVERKNQRLAEAERIRLEEARKAHVESVKQNAIKAAKAQGFSIKESIENGQVKLVLVRSV